MISMHPKIFKDPIQQKTYAAWLSAPGIPPKAPSIF
jgi:hypothetical protein